MSGWTLNYLFYAGIILPTVVTLVLFVFFVICWRKQSARKAILTKPYDPHGTMRRLGIPNKPPPPPVFIHASVSATEDLGGEYNEAYDMSRSPSAEAQASGRLVSPLTSPSGDADLISRLAYHSRLDSGLSEPACDSPGAVSGGGVGGVGSGGNARDRPQSQASHSSTTDSEDSGFRGSRSQYPPQNGQSGHNELPLLKRARSGRGKRGSGYHKAVSTPDSDSDNAIQLTPTSIKLSPITALPPLPPLSPTATPQRPPSAWPHHSQHQHPHISEQTLVKNQSVDLNDIGAHLGWKYLQDLTSPGGHHRHGGDAGHGPGQGQGHRQNMTCHQMSMTMAQVHQSHDLDNPDVFGFSVV